MSEPKKAKSKPSVSKDSSNNSDSPTRFEITTAKNKERLLWALEETRGLIYKACRLVDIHPSTYYAYLKEDPEFKDSVDELLSHQVDEVEGGLLDMIRSDKPGIRLAATDIYLKAKAKDRGYGSTKQELTGDLKHSHTVEVVRFEMPMNGTDEGERSPKPPEWDKAID